MKNIGSILRLVAWLTVVMVSYKDPFSWTDQYVFSSYESRLQFVTYQLWYHFQHGQGTHQTTNCLFLFYCQVKHFYIFSLEETDLTEICDNKNKL